MLITTNADVFKQNLDRRVEDLKESLINSAQKIIRERFDKCTLDSSSQACIDVAREMGFDELADEMAATHKSEKLEALQYA